MKEISLTEFNHKIAALQKAVSVQGKTYHSIRVAGGKVRFVREGKSGEECIDLNELFEFYKNVPHPTNQQARAYISGRVQSPAVSIINALSQAPRSVSEKSVPTLGERAVPKVSVTSARLDSATDQKDETRFFLAFAEAVGVLHLKSKSVAKPITSADIFLSDNYLDYGFEKAIETNFSAILRSLNSNLAFGSKSLSHFVDGMLIGHPQLGTRIVEFDEEQHFTPALRDALAIQLKDVDSAFGRTYLQQLERVDYLNAEVLKKHRVKQRFTSYPKSFADFTECLRSENVSGYIEAKENGFPYVGGRMAQRAYFDCLRNAAHLSPKNSALKSALRFPKMYFEDAANVPFKHVSQGALVDLIKRYLNEVYSVKI